MLQDLLNGIAIGSVYAVFALGYTLVFSILRVINFAHGAIFTVGAYLTWALTGSEVANGVLAGKKMPFVLPFWVAVAVGAVGAGLLGVIIERLAFRPLRKRGSDPLLTLVSSLGVAIALVNLIQYLVGAENYRFADQVSGSVEIAGARVRTVLVLLFAVSIVIVVALTWLINGTRTGAALRAVSEDQITAKLLGIDVDRLILISFFLSGLLGGLAGTLIGMSVGIAGPYFGIAFGLKGLAVIVLGGLGDIPGAVVAGLVIGLAEAFVPGDYIGYREAVAFVVLFVALLVRPQGLLGRVQIVKV